MERKRVDRPSVKDRLPRRKKYKVVLHRSYIVDVLAESKSAAMDCAEYFIGNPTDISTHIEKQKYNFEVKNIEMSYNNAAETI